MTKVIFQMFSNFIGYLAIRSQLAQPELAQRFKIWFLILKVPKYFLQIEKCTYDELKKKKNEVTFFFEPQLKQPS